MRVLATVATALVFLVNSTWAQEARTDTDKLRDRYDPRIHVVPDQVTGSPARVYGPFRPHPADVAVGSVAGTARNLIARNQDVLRVGPQDVREGSLHTIVAPKVGRVHRIEYRQAIDGVPVHGSRVFVALLNDASVLAMGAKTFRIPEMRTAPALSEDQALRIALSLNPGYKTGTAELVVLPEGAAQAREQQVVEVIRYRLVWDVSIDGPDYPTPEGYLIPLTYKLDAHTGAIVDQGYGVDFNYNLHGAVDHWRTVDRGGPAPESTDVATETLAEPVKLMVRPSYYQVGYWANRVTTDYTSPTFSYSLQPGYYDLFAYKHTGGDVWAQAYLLHLDLTAGDYEQHVGVVDGVGDHHVLNMWWHGEYAKAWFQAQGSTYRPSNHTDDAVDPESNTDPWGHVQIVTQKIAGENSYAVYEKNRILLAQSSSIRAEVIIHEWHHLVRRFLYEDAPCDSWVHEGMARYYACRAMADRFYKDALIDACCGHSINIDTGLTHKGSSSTPAAYVAPLPISYDERWTGPGNPTTGVIADMAWITASTLWDIVKHGVPPTGGAYSWMPDAGWDAVIWNGIAIYAPATLEELHLDIETMSYWWEDEEDADGDGLRDSTAWRTHAHDVFMEHGFPDHQWPLIPPGLPAPALQTALPNPVIASGGNFPNPFNPETWISFRLGARAEVSVTIYNARGAVVRVIELGSLPAGRYRDRADAAHWDGRNSAGEPVASGSYVYEIRAGSEVVTGRMLLTK